jgi:Ca2+-binding EF-hand superfamily protein
VAFQVFDRDGSGSISRKELEYIMTNCGGSARLNDKELSQMMAIVDKDNDGEISYQEFTDMML